MSDVLRDQTIIVFGATGRVGADVCRFLAEHGAWVAVHCNSNRTKADQIVQDIQTAGGKAFVIQANVMDQAAVKACMEEVVRRCGRIDGIINQIHRDKEFAPKNVADMEWADWESHLDAMKAHFLICREALPYMRKQHYGRIIYVSGGLSFRFFEGCSPFSAVKAGMNAFCKTLALEEGNNGITVNVIAPGKIVRPGDGLTDVSGEWEEMERKQLANNPLGRFCTPTDVANAAMLFFIPTSSYITGQTIYLAGGEIMPMP